jgi:hypothetical protein
VLADEHQGRDQQLLELRGVAVDSCQCG